MLARLLLWWRNLWPRTLWNVENEEYIKWAETSFFHGMAESPEFATGASIFLVDRREEKTQVMRLIEESLMMKLTYRAVVQYRTIYSVSNKI